MQYEVPLGISFNAEELAVIAASCEGLSDLRIGVKHDHLVGVLA